MIKGNIKSDIIIFQQTMLTEMIDTTYISKEKDIDAQNLSKSKYIAAQYASKLFGVLRKIMR